jgi:hypothetical protein
MHHYVTEHVVRLRSAERQTEASQARLSHACRTRQRARRAARKAGRAADHAARAGTQAWTAGFLAE